MMISLLKQASIALTLILTAALATPANAASRTYAVDLAASPDLDEAMISDICAIPLRITVGAGEDLATVVIKKTNGNNAKLKFFRIQDTSGSISGGDLKEPYMGDYRTQVFVVRAPGFENAYKDGIYNRVEILTFGDKAAPKAFQLSSELLNYRESAELAEGTVCGTVSFKLVK